MRVFKAIVEKDVETCERILSRATTNLQDGLGMTPLIYAVKNQEYAISELGLKRKAEPNKQDALGNTAPLRGNAEG